MIKVLLSLIFTLVYSLNQKPIIGIYTQDAPNNASIKKIYLAASYVKFLEMSGAQVVPIFYTDTQEQILQLLGQINGVLFPGGAQSINISNKWTKNADTILKYAIDQNQQGNPFPVLGVCLGHELLSYLTAGYDSKVRQSVSGQAPIVNTINITKNSELFNNWKSQAFKAVSQKHGILYFDHKYALYTKYFNESTLLTNFWDLISTTTSSAKQQFVSALQSKKYPIYSFQFHPEKIFEWKVDANRTSTSIQVVNLLSNNFVEKARLSKNSFKNQTDIYNKLIYNYVAIPPDPVFTLHTFQEIYFFDPTITELIIEQ